MSEFSRSPEASAAIELGLFIDASPSPFHACETALALLSNAGYRQVAERDPWPTDAGRYVVVRGGSLVAWTTTASTSAHDGFRVVGAHTDSPNLRLKQLHDRFVDGTRVIALEPYGGPLLHTWLDRDLGIAGRVALRDGSERLVHVTEPVVRVPNLAIHLDHDDSKLNRQRHLDGVWGIGRERTFLGWLGEREGFAASDVLGFELMTTDLQLSALVGADSEFLAAPRLDNQGTCFAAVRALIDAPEVEGQRSAIVLFDHEEVGSTSERGAQSDLLGTVIERTVLAAGGTRDDVHRTIAASLVVSGDMAHASHPNHRERHEPLHQIILGGGPVLKVNQNLRYATDARGAAAFARSCEAAGVPLQRYVHRADLPCGSTIGPMSAARTGITTVDVGAPQLAMHSAREMMAADDVNLYVRALTSFVAGN